MRFYDPLAGKVLFNLSNKDSIDLKSLRFDTIRKTIGYVGQEPVLIGKTLREVLLADQKTD